MVPEYLLLQKPKTSIKDSELMKENLAHKNTLSTHIVERFSIVKDKEPTMEQESYNGNTTEVTTKHGD